MKRSDRGILLGVAIVGLLAAFWFVILTPKRDEVSALDDEIAVTESAIAEQQALVDAGEAAKGDYATEYQRLVVLGKAVPADDEAGSLFVEFNDIAARSKVGFSSIVVGEADTAAPAPAALTQADPPAEGQAAAPDTAQSPDQVAIPGEAGTPAALPTEASASLLPLGATVGSAGLPVIPYDLQLEGDFFGFADFFQGVDQLVSTKGTGVAASGVTVDGRLVTINGFEIKTEPGGGLSATVQVTTYVTPADQGITGGATPTAPAATTVSTPAPSGSPAPAATVTP